MAANITLTKKLINSAGDVVWTGSGLGHDSGAEVWTTDFTVPGLALKGNRWVSALVVASAISGTNVDVALYGSMVGGESRTALSTRFQLKDAVVADVTNAAKVQGGVVDLAAYPAPFYSIGLLHDASEAANTLTVTIFVPSNA